MSREVQASTPERAEALVRSDPWACGPWCWVIDDVRLLPDPIPCRGAQGLWHLSWPAGEGPPPWQKVLADRLTALVPGSNRYGWSALTVLQPFATAIARGPKRVENRPWRRRLPPGGLWLGLHAGKALAGTDDEVEDALASWRLARWLDAPELDEMPRGAMLGAFHIARILPYPEVVRG